VDTPALKLAKRTRIQARKTLTLHEQKRASLDQLFSAIYVAEDAYSDLDEDDARAYRRWAFATAPDVVKMFGIKPAMEIVR
jgi:hypothetical protein